MSYLYIHNDNVGLYGCKLCYTNNINNIKNQKNIILLCKVDDAKNYKNMISQSEYYYKHRINTGRRGRFTDLYNEDIVDMIYNDMQGYIKSGYKFEIYNNHTTIYNYIAGQTRDAGFKRPRYSEEDNSSSSKSCTPVEHDCHRYSPSPINTFTTIRQIRMTHANIDEIHRYTYLKPGETIQITNYTDKTVCL